MASYGLYDCYAGADFLLPFCLVGIYPAMPAVLICESQIEFYNLKFFASTYVECLLKMMGIKL